MFIFNTLLKMTDKENCVEVLQIFYLIFMDSTIYTIENVSQLSKLSAYFLNCFMKCD